MTVFNFPDTTGQPIDGSFTWTAPSGVLYVWNGEAWVTQGSGGSSGGGSKVYVTDDLTTIADPEIGDLAYHTVEARLYVYYQDSDSQQWVDASPAGDANDAGGDSLWSRVGSVLTPAFTGDDIETTGDLSAASGTFENGLEVYYPGVGGNVIQEWRSDYPSANHAKARLYANGSFSIGGAGIGVSTPVFSIGGLDGSTNIGGDIAGGSPNIALNADGSITAAGRIQTIVPDTTTSLLDLRSATGGANTRKFHVASDGTVGIGGTNAITSPQVLIGPDGKASFSDSGLTAIGDGNFNYRGNGVIEAVKSGNSIALTPNWNGSGAVHLLHTSGGGDFRIRCGTNNGVDLAVNGSSWTSGSDERLKRNLASISDGLNKVSQLRAVTGQYLNDDEGVSRSFLVAQDVQKVLPEAVYGEEGDLKLAYTEVIPLLVSALHDAKDRIEALEATNASVEARLTALEGGN